MEVSVKKLEKYVGYGGEYIDHCNKFHVDNKSSDDTDYLCVMGYYVIAIPKNKIRFGDALVTCQQLKLEDKIIDAAEDAEYELEYGGLESDFNNTKKVACRFKNPKGEDIYVNRTFFTEFMNRAFSATGGFAKGVTFTGSNNRSPVLMWDAEENLVGMFMPMVKNR